MKLNLTLSTAALCLAFSVSAQQQLINGRGCGTHLPPEGWDQAFNKKVDEYKQRRATAKTMDAAYVIPVVVHLIHGGQAVGVYPNVSKAQINSQIAVMNNDYAGIGYNAGTLANTAFAAIGAANCHVTFCLAEVDPNGNILAEPGIDRVNYNDQNWANPNSFSSENAFQSFIDSDVKPNTIWDPNAYFNIWITDVNSNVGLLGYSTFPANSTLAGLSGNMSSTQNDGIWVYTRAFGNTGTLQSPYNHGRTASHETGHYLGLRHIGGDGQPNGTGNSVLSGDCSATDYCDDTPPQKGGYSGGQYGQNFGAPAATAPLHQGVCSDATDGDMFMNFMDYTDDASCYMFTPDQAVRMATALENSPFRVNLGASSATMCSIPSFYVPDEGCVNSGLQLNNNSTGAANYLWTSIPSTGVTFSPSATSPSPVVVFSTAGSYSITMTATSAIGTSTNSVVNKVAVSNCVTGIAKNAMLIGNVILAPNPSSGIVNVITSLSGSQNLQITIHNSLGQVVSDSQYSHVTAGSFSLDLSALPVGMYMVTVSNGAEKTVKRLVLSK